MTRLACELLPPRRTAVGRADLLWLLHSLGEYGATEAARLIGYRIEAQLQALPPTRSPTPRADPELRPALESVRRPPLRAIHFDLIEYQSVPPEAEPTSGQASPLGPLIERLTGTGEVPPPRRSLSPLRRLVVFLREYLRPARPGCALDLPRLLGQLVQLRLPRRLPRRLQSCWSRDAALVIDLSLPAFPMNDDLIELAELGHRLSGGGLCILAHLSQGEWQMRRPGARPAWVRVSGAQLSRARHWLLAGDLGSVSGDGSSAGWALRIRQHQAGGGEVTVLTGCCPPSWSAYLPPKTRVTLWDHGRHLKPRRAARAAAAPAVDVSCLLAALSLAVRVEPGLLRDVRLELGLSMISELTVWNHEDVLHCELGMHIRPERLPGHRAGVATLTSTLHERIVGLVTRHHLGLSRLIRMEEAALAADLTGLRATEAATDWAAAVRTLQQEPHGEVAQDLSSYLVRTGRRAHSGLWRTVPALEDAYVIVRSEAFKAGAQVPDGVSARTLQRHVVAPAEMGLERPLWIVRRGTQLEIHTREPGPGVFVFATSPDCVGLKLSVPGRSCQWLQVQNEPMALGELRSGAGPWTVETPWLRVKIAEVLRPSWAIEWGNDREGLYAFAPSPLGRLERLDWLTPGQDDDYLSSVSDRGFSTAGVPVGAAMWLGADLEFGLFLDVPFGRATQRFRWIESGEFLMGAPEGEMARLDLEGPQHVVRLSEGFWLAETACSQVVWEAVMGGNPSYFKDDPQNPVEQVSWDDVIEFLRKVEVILPGVRVCLPTEAEWEYACRAGAREAFNWRSDRVTPEQANYDGRANYEGGAIQAHWGKTIPVQMFAPNAWGLFQMHGNVWEWCLDGMRTYNEAEQEGVGAERGVGLESLRVVRGGSWRCAPEYLRSACRMGQLRDYRYRDVGFRFSLRPASPGRWEATLILPGLKLQASGSPVVESEHSASRLSGSPYSRLQGKAE